MMTLLVGVIILFVIPAFSQFYSDFGKQLPLLTRIIVGLSNNIVKHISLIVFGVVAAVVGFVVWTKQPGQRERLDRIVLEVPVLGASVRKFGTAQLARTLATLLGGGIPLVHSIEISARAMSNRHLARELEIVRQAVQEGQSFAAALRARNSLPDVAVKMIEVGESTGALQEMLNTLADFYDEEIESEVARFITLVEPVLLVVMGVIIAMVVLALYLPLFQLGSVVGS